MPWRNTDGIAMSDKPKRPPRAGSFWIVIILVLAVVVAASWYVIVQIIGPILDAVIETYF